MMRCDDCQSLLLDHLYGLLDPAEAASVEEHLGGCPGCAAARDQAGRLQGLIAQAAKTEFPGVRFDPEAEPERAPTAPAAAPAATPTTPAPPRPERPSRFGFGLWVRWAVAASVLAALPAVVLVANQTSGKLETARHQAAVAAIEAQNAQDSTREIEDRNARAVARYAREQTAYIRKLADREAAGKAVNRFQFGPPEPFDPVELARKQRDNVLAAWVAAEKLALQPDAGRFSVQVDKPATIQPGAPNELVLNVRDGRKNVSSAPVQAEVCDQTGRVLYRQAIDHARRGDTHAMRIPVSVWTEATPQTELYFSVATYDDKTGARTELQQRIPLRGPVFATYLVTDRSTYRPGEPVFFRSLTLNRVTFRPPSQELRLRYELRAKNGKPVPGAEVQGADQLVRVTNGEAKPLVGPDGNLVRGVGCGEFYLPETLADGEYVLTLTELPSPTGSPLAIPFPVTRTLKVRSGAAEQYLKRIGFEAASFSPGQTVEAWAQLTHQGKPAAGVPVEVTATADGHAPIVRVSPVNHPGRGRLAHPVTDLHGWVRIQFRLPPAADLPRGDVRLKVTFRTPDGDESIAERVPVIGRDVVVEFFPEGGKLVAGVPCRVYVRATTPGGDPVEMRGVITDERGRVAARFETAHDNRERGVNRGIGSVVFTPLPGQRYWLVPTEPANLAGAIVDGPLAAGRAAAIGVPAAVASRVGYRMPAVEREGVVMTVRNPVTTPGEPIRVELYSADRDRNLVIGAYTRGRLVDTKRILVKAPNLGEKPAPTQVLLLAGDGTRGGVTRVTVFEDPNRENAVDGKDLIPVAERLVYRKPGEKLNIALSASSPGRTKARLHEEAGKQTEPGWRPHDPFELSFDVTDETGKPVAAVVWAAVVNAALGDTPQDRLMTTHFLLAGEVQAPDDLEYADFLLSDGPMAAAALDRVLATQGWRRFVEQQPDARPEGAVAPRNLTAARESEQLLVVNGQYPVRVDPVQLRQQAVFEKHWPLYEAACKTLDAAERAAGEAKRAGAAPAAAAAPVPAPLPPVLQPPDVSAGAMLAAYDTSRREVQHLAEIARRWAWLGAAALAGLALVASGIVVVRPHGPRGALPLGLAAAAAAGLAVFLVLTARRADPGPLPEVNAAAVTPTRAATESRTPALSDRADATPESVVKPEGPVLTPMPREKQPAPPAGSDKGFGPGGPGLTIPNGMPGGGIARADPPPSGPAGGMFGTPRPPPGAGGALPLPGGLPPGMPPPNLVPPPPSPVTLPGTPAPLSPPLPKAPGGPLPTGSGTGKDATPTTIPARPPVAFPAPPGAPSASNGRGGLGGGNGGTVKLGTLPGRRGTDDWFTGRATPVIPNIELRGSLRRAKGERAEIDDNRASAFKKRKLASALGRDQDEKAAREAQNAWSLRQAQVEPFFRSASPSGEPSGYAANGVQLTVDQKALKRVKEAVAGSPPFVLRYRQYAAPRPGAGTRAESLTASPDTLLWEPVIVLPTDGTTTIPFQLGTSSGGYQVIVGGHTPDGRIGAARGFIPIARPEAASPATPPAPK